MPWKMRYRMLREKKAVMKDLGKTLRNRFVLQKRSVVKDELQQQKEEWVDWRDVWGETQTLWGSEYYAAKAVNEENTIEFVIRKAPFLSEMNTLDYRVLWNGKSYDIRQIDEMSDESPWIKIKAMERGASG